MTLVFEGRLDLDTFATHVPHKFQLPPGVGTLRVAFTHSPEHPGAGDIPHQFSISVHGPHGARGTRHCNADQSPIISAEWASPGYLPGPIEPGEWTVEIDVHRILPPGEVDYSLSVEWQNEETVFPEVLPKRQNEPRSSGAGWYEGDLHGHTFHSDGSMSIPEFLDHALGMGYNFVALTDHNTVSGLAELKSRAGADILVIGGVELTTFHGHAVVLGTYDWQEWRIKDGSTMAGIVSAQHAAGRLFIIAHPMAVGHPFCTGCTWAYSDTWPGAATHVEIWNGVWDSGPMNELGLQLYHSWLNAGHRMIATSGTDVHDPHGPDDRVGRVVVWAEALTEPAILAGIARGRCYVTSGPRLDFHATAPDGTIAQMGENLLAEKACLHAKWKNTEPTFEARLIMNGACIARVSCGDATELVQEVDQPGRNWALIEIRDHSNGLHAMSNPIFLGSWIVEK